MRARLAEKGIYTIPIGRQAIEVFRQFVTDTLLEGHEQRKTERVAAMHARCGCTGGPGPTTPPSGPVPPPWQDPGPWH